MKNEEIAKTLREAAATTEAPNKGVLLRLASSLEELAREKSETREAAREKRELETFRFQCVDVAKALAGQDMDKPLIARMSANQIADRAIDIVTQIWDKTEPK